MPRRKTKGDPIQIRLPVDLDALLRSHAQARNETPAMFVENCLASSAGEGWVYPIGTPDSARRLVVTGEAAERSSAIHAAVKAGKVTEIGEICKHPRSMHTILNGGLAKCRCGAVRNAAGEWHE